MTDTLTHAPAGAVCESCGRPADVALPDGSHWCWGCDGSARRLGYDDGTNEQPDPTPVPERMAHMTTGDVLLKLPSLCRQHRRSHGLSYHQAARVIGIPASALHNLEHGGESRLSTVTADVRWMESWL